MRRAMICITVMLAVLQCWPMLFGKTQSPVEVAKTAASAGVRAAGMTSTQLVPAVAQVTRQAQHAMGQATGSKEVLSCYRHYEIAFAACRPGDRACRMGAADQWDLCEATGLWGN